MTDLRRLAEQATPGRLYFGEGDRHYSEDEVFLTICRDDAREQPVVFVQIGSDQDPTTDELAEAISLARLIAAVSPELVLDLLDRAEAGDRLRAALEEAEDALRSNVTTWITLEGHLDTPYSDDPRWSPWTRFGKRAMDRAGKALLAAREALAGGGR